MSFSINTDDGFARRGLNSAQQSNNKVLQRLSSMLRINSAKDDAAGLAIFQRQTAAVRGTDQGIRNTNDAISFVQTAQGGLAQVTDNLQRMRELTIQASNSIVTDRGAIQAEIDQLSEENTRLTGSSFGGQAIFPSGSQTASFQVGADAGNQINVNLKSLDGLNSVSSDQGGNSIDVSSASAAQQSIAKIDADLEAVSQQASNFGAIENRFGSAIANAETFSINTQQSRSRIGDTDVAKEVSNMIQAQIRQQTSIAAAAQGNQSRKMVLSLLGNGNR